MRYHYKEKKYKDAIFGRVYFCNHPVYNRCTLFKIGNKGLSVIQQRYNKEIKTTYWNEIDPWIANDLYLHPNFKDYFDKHSGNCTDGLYPTVTVRQIMWALRIKPIKKEPWETYFDRPYI